MKKILIALIKYGISFTILGYLFYAASQDESFHQLRESPKNWLLLVLAFLLMVVGVVSTIVRWHLLVRALDMPFSIRDAFRLGFLGYLFTFITMGVVGGDLLKAVFLARQQPGRRAEAVATVVVDRIIGLFALFFVATVAFLTFGLDARNVRDPNLLSQIQYICYGAVGFTIAGTVGFLLLLLPGFTSNPLWDALVGLPKIGHTIGRLIGAVRMYRRRLPLLLFIFVMSAATHVVFTLSVYCTASGLPGNHPSFSTHLVIVQIASLCGALPLPGGLGAFEYVLDYLYRAVSSADVAARQGFVVALAFLVIKLLIAAIGMVYYVAGRRQVKELIAEAEKSHVMDDLEEVTQGAGKSLAMPESPSAA
jgi:hypothetical protein